MSPFQKVRNGCPLSIRDAIAGCAGAHAELMEVAGKLKAPIVSALRGREHIQFDNPYEVGLTGLIGFSSGYHATKDAATLLMLGTDFPYTQFYPEKATVIQVDQRVSIWEDGHK